MQPFLTVRNISHIYHDIENETLALSDISFDIYKTEFVAIVGPSGCGKTTLLSILSGRILPCRGTVTIDGKSANQADVGYMLQHDHLFEWQSIRKNALLGLKVQHKLNDETRLYTYSLLEKYGLSDFADSYPEQLSGGMRQKAALIRTLALRPSLLLLDEPFSALDFQTRLTLSDEVYGIIRREKMTTILVTHDISEAVAMADRVFVLTARPAKMLSVHSIELDGETPTIRRADSRAGEYFNIIRNELGR